jgi:predicted GTPase
MRGREYLFSQAAKDNEVMDPIRVIIMGAAGRDFHNFNTCFRQNPDRRVVAFTATQIPNIEGRVYPPQLAGPLYPEGIPIYPESELTRLIREYQVDQIIFSYSDVSHEEVMHRASVALAAGADFVLLGPKSTALQSYKPVVAVCAVRTGCGKSPTSRYVVNYLMRKGLRVAVVRHPMPYGDLVKEEVQRFAVCEDFIRYNSTIEEREEYEPYVRRGVPIFAGVDYEKILRLAEQECDVVLWDGGNNDLPFYQPDLHITIADPHRPGHELRYYPGEANLRAAHVILIGKTGSAPKAQVALVRANARKANPQAVVLNTDLKITSPHAAALRGKKVVVVEDGPTLTHGGMTYGAGALFAKKHQARIADVSLHAVGSIRSVYKKYPHLNGILPAMGYSQRQVQELEATINRTPCDFVIAATPIKLKELIHINQPVVEVSYELKAPPRFNEILDQFAAKCSVREEEFAAAH